MLNFLSTHVTEVPDHLMFVGTYQKTSLWLYLIPMLNVN